LIEVAIVKRMGWSPDDMAHAPVRLVTAVKVDMAAEGKIRKRQADEQRRELERMRNSRG